MRPTQSKGGKGKSFFKRALKLKRDNDSNIGQKSPRGMILKPELTEADANRSVSDDAQK